MEAIVWGNKARLKDTRYGKLKRNYLGWRKMKGNNSSNENSQRIIKLKKSRNIKMHFVFKPVIVFKIFDKHFFKNLRFYHAILTYHIFYII